jgi:ribosome-binding protein aMBF1 (putative translation factor)
MARRSVGDGQLPQIDVSVGKRIDAALREAGLTRAQLAVALAVDETTVDAYCDGRQRVPATILVDIARLLNWSIRMFFEDATSHWKNGTCSAKKK